MIRQVPSSARDIPSVVYSVSRLGIYSIEIEPEVREWLDSLADREFGRVEFLVELLAESAEPSRSARPGMGMLSTSTRGRRGDEW